ncbi:phosphatase PAP2 family protein [Methylosinus sp. LW4]|uniref:phosphatase PAP2 family protein n=1 Tax=Methylosinus sp. LW4 TaxID=136993 RepID=UPI0003731EC8|nr:phosphatase PAP2 family protein [Methylosinus sp. LW4]
MNGSVAKAHFHREHPYNVDKTLKTICKTKTKADSYPSGHTLLGWLLGLTLVEMVPEKRDEIIARAEDYGHSRMVCGLHYKSDLQASKLIAYTVHAIMKQNPEYLKELSAAKTETRTLLGLSNLPK